MFSRITVSALVLAFGIINFAVTSPDRRIVDSADAGDAASEAAHGYVGEDAFAGVAGGKSYRQARGWMRFALRTFDDTEVTVACTFASNDRQPSRYDVLVEDSLIATQTLGVTAADTVVETRVPFGLTKGKGNIAVVIKAHDGPTPALRVIRTVQDHNEFQQDAAPRNR